jgi:MPBQ/MSBQ methyltransferase
MSLSLSQPERITLMDQSPHQLEKARKKELLKGVTIIEGDPVVR